MCEEKSSAFISFKHKLFLIEKQQWNHRFSPTRFIASLSSVDSMMWYGKYGDNQWYSDACFHVLQAMTSYCWYILNIYCKHIHPLLSLFHYFIVPRKCPIYLFLIITIVTSCKRIVVGTDATNLISRLRLLWFKNENRVLFILIPILATKNVFVNRCIYCLHPPSILSSSNSPMKRVLAVLPGRTRLTHRARH